LISNNNIYWRASGCVIDGITLPTLVYYTMGMANLKIRDLKKCLNEGNKQLKLAKKTGNKGGKMTCTIS